MRKFFTALNDALVAADESGDAETWLRMYAFGNALFEGIWDSRAPGSSSQSIIGHDHTDSTVTGYHGGRPLSRNVVYSGMVQDSDSVHLYAASPPSASTSLKVTSLGNDSVRNAPGGAARFPLFSTLTL